MAMVIIKIQILLYGNYGHFCEKTRDSGTSKTRATVMTRVQLLREYLSIEHRDDWAQLQVARAFSGGSCVSSALLHSGNI